MTHNLDLAQQHSARATLVMLVGGTIRARRVSQRSWALLTSALLDYCGASTTFRHGRASIHGHALCFDETPLRHDAAPCIVVFLSFVHLALDLIRHDQCHDHSVHPFVHQVPDGDDIPF